MSLENVAASGNNLVVVNNNFTALEHVAVYGHDASTSSGLTRGYIGGRWGGFAVADQTKSLTNAATNYVVVLRSDGVLSVSTASTNWDNTTAYARVEKLTTAGSVVTVEEDHRAGLYGVHGPGTAASQAEFKALTFTSDTDSTADSDPGNGLFKWNHATQASATVLYFDNQTVDAISLTTLWGNLGAVGYIHLQQYDDATKWQLWRWSAAPVDGTGYRKFTVALQASGGSIADAKTVQVLFMPGATPGSDNFGYLNLPQNSQSAAYTTVLADAGKHILHPTADNNPRTFTIDSNANVAYPLGTEITFINQINTVTIAITSDTLTLAGAGTTGSRTLAAAGIATAVKIGTTNWIISGTGLT